MKTSQILYIFIPFLLTNCSTEKIEPESFVQISSFSVEKVISTGSYTSESNRRIQSVYQDNSNALTGAEMTYSNETCDHDDDCQNLEFVEKSQFDFEDGVLKGRQIIQSDFGRDEDISIQNGRLIEIRTEHLDKSAYHRFYYNGEKLVKIENGYVGNPNLIAAQEMEYDGNELIKTIIHDFAKGETVEYTYQYDRNTNPFYNQKSWHLLLEAGYGKPVIGFDPIPMIYSPNNLVSVMVSLGSDEQKNILRTYKWNYDETGLPFKANIYDNLYSKSGIEIIYAIQDN